MSAREDRLMERHITMANDDPTISAIDEADRFVRRAIANVAHLPENSLRRSIEENLTRALDVLQAELEEAPDE